MYRKIASMNVLGQTLSITHGSCICSFLGDEIGNTLFSIVLLCLRLSRYQPFSTRVPAMQAIYDVHGATDIVHSRSLTKRGLRVVGCARAEYPLRVCCPRVFLSVVRSLHEQRNRSCCSLHTCLSLFDRVLHLMLLILPSGGAHVGLRSMSNISVHASKLCLFFANCLLQTYLFRRTRLHTSMGTIVTAARKKRIQA